MKNKKIILFSIIIGFISLCIIGYFIFDKIILEYLTYPKIYLNGENNIRLSLGDEYKELGSNATLRNKDISDKIIIYSNLDINSIGIYKIIYTVYNDKNNKLSEIERIIEVYDNISPVINLNGSDEIILYANEIYKELGYSATDNYDGDITSLVEVSSDLDTSKIGNYQIRYNVKDSSNNSFEIVRKINVQNKPATTSVRGLPVLMYHYFFDDRNNETGKDGNWLEISKFEEQMKYLSDNNYYYPTWDEVYHFVNGTISIPDKSVVITIDDGNESFFRLAIPILKKYNITATSFVITGRTNTETINKYKSSILNFESHSHDMHKAGSDGKGAFLTMSYNEAKNDLLTSKNIIGSGNAFCYPFGNYSDFTFTVLKDTGFKVAVTTENGRVYPGFNRFKLPRIRMNKGESLNNFINKVK